MGDRCNFIISYSSTAGKTVEASIPGSLVLYSHGGGHEAAHDLKAALLAARPRWDDYSYGARIIVSCIIGPSWSGETGFGLTVGEIGDNEHAYLLIDMERKVVRCEDRELSFGAFIALNEDAANKFSGRSFEED